jgi:uncharacterized membrane protein
MMPCDITFKSQFYDPLKWSVLQLYNPAALLLGSASLSYLLYLQSDIKRSISNGEERFNQLSLEERGKFDEETLVNVNNLRRRMMAAPKADRFNNEYIVVTILVAAEGEYKLPTINSNADLKDALRKLGSIPVDSIQAVEVLWTPQDENDTLSERELLRDYPLLRPL